MADYLHPERTRRSNFEYLFTDKHHGGDRNAARWSPELSEAQEFSVFDEADWHELSNSEGWLFGVLRLESDLSVLGTKGELVAGFDPGNGQQPWHGYPVYPLKSGDQKGRPEKVVFARMVQIGMITLREKKRLLKARH